MYAFAFDIEIADGLQQKMARLEEEAKICCEPSAISIPRTNAHREVSS